jgi:acetone carboxylase gamma subunit
MNIKQLLDNVQNLHSNIAQDVWPNGEDRYCPTCGQVIHMTTADCGYALAHGWPRHCGHSMLLVEKEE